MAAPTGFPFLRTHPQSAVGSQVNVFYPSQMLQPLIILIRVFQRPVTCLFIYAILLSVLTAILTDYAVFSVIKDRQLSFLTAVLYTFSDYRMMDFYQQFDLGEFIALAFLPLVFARFYHMMKYHNEKWQIVFGLTGMLFSHVVLTFLAILFLGTLFLLALLRSSKCQQLLGDGILLGVCTLDLSSVFWLPVLSHQLTTISGLEPTYWKESVVTTNSLSVIWQNLLRNRILYFHTPGTFLTFSGLIVSVIIFIHYRKMNSLWMTTAFLFILTLCLITQLFPWAFFKNTVIVVVQMAPRFSAFATFIASGLVAYGLIQVFNNIRGRQIFYFLTIIIACGMTLSAIQDVANEYNANQMPVVTNQNFRQFSAIDHRRESFDYFPHQSRPFVSELS